MPLLSSLSLSSLLGRTIVSSISADSPQVPLPTPVATFFIAGRFGSSFFFGAEAVALGPMMTPLLVICALAGSKSGSSPKPRPASMRFAKKACSRPGRCDV